MSLSDLSQSTGFMSAVLSDDPTKIAAVLSPQIKAMQDQGTQQKQKAAHFNNRGGGGTNGYLQRVIRGVAF